MCAINPKHKKTFTMEVYTSANMTDDDFLRLVRKKILIIETQLNEDMRLRWHVTERMERK